MSLGTPMARAVVNENQHETPKTNWKRYYRNLNAFLESRHVSLQARGFLMYLWSLQGQKTHAFPSIRQLREEVGSDTLTRKLTQELRAALGDSFKVERGRGRRRNSYTIQAFEFWPDKVYRFLKTGESENAQNATLEAVVPVRTRHYMELRKHDTITIDNTSIEREIPMDVTGQKLRRSTGPDDIATCSVCKKETADWLRVENGDYYCSMACIEKYQPRQWKVKQ